MSAPWSTTATLARRGNPDTAGCHPIGPSRVKQNISPHRIGPVIVIATVTERASADFLYLCFYSFIHKRQQGRNVHLDIVM